jgi:hypothetical protein
VVASVVANQFSTHALRPAGAREPMTVGQFQLAYSMTPPDVAAL